MRCSTCRVIRFLLPTLALAISASAQIAPSEVGETGFFGPGVTYMFEQQFPSFTSAHDKNNPFKMQLPMGVMYGFFHQGDPYLVIGGTGKIDFGQDVALPTNALVLNDFVWIYSRKNITLQVSDFPAELGDKLRKFWTLPSITLLEKGSVLRAAPTGDVLDGVRGFLMLDNLSGTTVLAFAKNKTVKTTQLMLNGTITNPFGMEMTLTNPLISYTKRTKVPGTVMGLASNISIKSHAYEFQAEGDVKLRKPEIFVLKTASMNPQNVIDVVAALSKPLFPSTVGTIPAWNLGGIPTFQLHPPKTASTDFPPEDQSKVVVYAAVADKPEWGIKGPALKIRGNLAIETKPKQDIAVVELVADASSLHAAFGLPSFTLPGSDLSFGTASAEISSASSSTSMRISAATTSRCFQQRFSFTVGTTGIPQVDLNATQTLKTLTPEGFASNFKYCANEGVKTAKYIFDAGVSLFGFGQDKLLDATLPIFITENAYRAADYVVDAAKQLGFPAATVGTAIGKVFDKTAVLDVADKFYGSEAGNVAKAAGASIEDVLRWGIGRKSSYQAAGWVLQNSTYAKDQLLSVAGSIYPAEQVGVFGQAAGKTAEQVMSWASDKGLNSATMGKVFNNAAFGVTETLNAANKLLKSEEFAPFAKAASYSVDQVMTWGKNGAKSAEAMGQLIGTAAYGKDELLDAGKKVFGNDYVAALGSAAGYGAEDIYHWTFARKMGPGDAGKLVAKAFHKDYVLESGKKVFNLGNEGVAELGKAVGYSATDMSHWFFKMNVGQKEVAKVLRAGGYAKNEVTSGLQTVYKVGSGTAEDLWNDAVKGAGKIGGYIDPRNWW